ncbi:Lcl domain-containing protein [Candidatus Electrothrix sp.]|uniref:Lcl domain-containing protein n=1 Tax=Candidatus Electrothrix sp. TaxID=2170559 RepID=UPI004056DF53
MKRIYFFIPLSILIASSICYSYETCQSIRAQQNERFRIDENGLVTDISTGLTWSRCAYGQAWDDSSQSCTGTIENLIWNDALVGIDNIEYAGFSDWRMPNMKELASIILFGCSPAINEDFFSVIEGTNQNVWTSQADARVPENSWLFMLSSDGIVREGDKITTPWAYSYMVRGGGLIFFPVETERTDWINYVGAEGHTTLTIWNGKRNDSIRVDDTFAMDLNLPGNAENNMWVIAPQSGTVVKRFDNHGMVLIRHDTPLYIASHVDPVDPWYSNFIHMDDIQVNEGDPIDIKTKIGTISNTSPSTMPVHLHYVIYEYNPPTETYESIDIENALPDTVTKPISSHGYWCGNSVACTKESPWWGLNVSPCSIPDTSACAE